MGNLIHEANRDANIIRMKGPSGIAHGGPMGNHTMVYVGSPQLNGECACNHGFGNTRVWTRVPLRIASHSEPCSFYRQMGPRYGKEQQDHG